VPLGHRPSGGDHPCHLGIDRSGRWLAVANYGTGSASVFPIGTDGALGAATATVRHSGRGHHPGRQAGPHAHAAVFSADGRLLMVADLGVDRVVVYGFDDRDGTLVRVADLVCAPGAGPRHLALHPDGTHVFVVNELDSTLSVYAVDGPSGEVQPSHTVSTLPEPHPGNLAAGVHLSPDGTHVYVSNRGHDSIATFAWEPGTGLQRSTVRPSGGRTPRSFALTPDGRHLVVANQGSDALTVLPVLPGGGDVGAAVARIGVTAPTCVVVRPGAS
jgi:6-phosphogluconolactonase